MKISRRTTTADKLVSVELSEGLVSIYVDTWMSEDVQRCRTCGFCHRQTKPTYKHTVEFGDAHVHYRELRSSDPAYRKAALLVRRKVRMIPRFCANQECTDKAHDELIAALQQI